MKRIICYLFFLISPFTSCVMDDLSIKSTLMWDDNFDLAPRIPSEATELEVPFIFSVQEAWTVVVTTDGDGDIDAKDTGAGEEQWLSVDKMEGEAGDNIPLAITFDANATDQREGRVTITTAGGSSVELTIIQEGDKLGKNVFTYDEGCFDIIQTVLSSATILTPSFSFSVQDVWTVSVTPEGDDQWLTVEKQDGGEAGIDIAFPITFEANATDVEREGAVTITANSGHSITLEIIQEGKLSEDVFTYDDGFELTPTVPFTEGSLDPVFEFSSTETWDVTVTPTDDSNDISWVTVPKNGVANTNIAFPISFEENETYFDRTATITIETIPASGNEIVFNITQENGFLELSASGQLENDFNNQSLSTSITSLSIEGAALKKVDWRFLSTFTNLKYLDIEGTITTTIYGNVAGYDTYIPNIETILLPSTLKKIRDWAFVYCTGLTSITFASDSQLTTIGAGAFQECTGLTSITLPAGVTTIGDGVFYGCTGLTSMDLPDGLTTIERRAFKGCTGLTSITLPAGVITIGMEAFDGCRGLTSIDLSDVLTSIGHYAFENCSSLTSLTLHEVVREIGINAFEGCTGLTSITMKATTPPELSKNSNNDCAQFDNTNNCYIYVPSGSVEAYKNSSEPNTAGKKGWIEYKDRIKDIATKP